MRQAGLRFSLIVIIKYLTFIMKGRFVNIVAVYWLQIFLPPLPEEQEAGGVKNITEVNGDSEEVFSVCFLGNFFWNSSLLM